MLYVPADSAAGPSGAQEINVLPNEHTATINNLAKWTKYKVWVKAYTRVGDGPLSPAIIVLTDEDGMSATILHVPQHILQYQQTTFVLFAVTFTTISIKHNPSYLCDCKTLTLNFELFD